MKKLLKRLELICLVLMLSFSMAACGEKEEKETAKISKEEKSDKKDKNKDKDDEDKDDEDEDDEDDDKESSKIESVAEATPEPTAVPTAEPTAEPQDETRKYDEEALEILEESYMVLAEVVSTQNLEYVDEARLMLKDINTRKCSKEVRRLIDEYELVIDDVELIYSWVDDLMVYIEEYESIDMSFSDLTEFSDLDQIKKEYYELGNVIEKINAMEPPQIYQQMMNNVVSVFEKYRVLMSELYTAQQNQDYLTEWSAYCFYNDLESEMEGVLSDMEETARKFEEHLAPYQERMENLISEFKDNFDAIEENYYEDVDFSYMEKTEKTKVSTSITCIDTIYPAMYNKLQAVAIVNLSYAKGSKDVLVTVEVDGFSQKYEKTIEVNQFPQRYYIKPPVISSGLNLNSQKTTQVKVSVTDVETGNIIASETETVKIMSINDFILSDNEYGYTTYSDILAWVTPESDYIQDLLREAADNMEEYTGYNGIPGYQYISDDDELMITAYQVYAIQKAISDLGVRYVMSSYSIGEATNATQRVNRPDETLLSKSGICIETSVLMASALQAAGMNSMIVLTTGHCQVAVETWNGSGEYLLIETTLLPVEGPWDSRGSSDYMNTLLTYYDNDEWLEYLDNNNGMVYSCNLATYMGIIPLIYE